MGHLGLMGLMELMGLMGPWAHGGHRAHIMLILRLHVCGLTRPACLQNGVSLCSVITTKATLPGGFRHLFYQFESVYSILGLAVEDYHI
jgi:hypothetical protein